jgi:hypothetical protein
MPPPPTTDGPSTYCRRCSYDLRGLPDPRCPECGQPFDPANPRTFRRRPKSPAWKWLRRILILLITLAILIGAPLLWLYRGWNAEQKAIFQLRAAGIGVGVKPTGPPWLQKALPRPLRPLLDRADWVYPTHAGHCPDGFDLADLSHLREVMLPGASDTTLANADKLQSIETLNLPFGRLTNRGIAHLSELTQLRELLLEENPDITDQGLASLRKLTRLRALGLSKSRLTDAGIANLQHMADLEWLDLEGCSVGDEGMRIVARMTKLQQLNLKNCAHVTDEGLAQIDGLPALECLSLRGARITDAGLAYLSHLPRLASLDLSYTRITDKGLAHLAALTSLQELSICATAITENGLLQLASLKNLQDITAYETTIPDGGTARLKTALPKVTIINFPQSVPSPIPRPTPTTQIPPKKN